ncbi:hypothetical protein N1851_000419 [Merluccius polli]|uniref:Uncharacterized protein n=1 Tax=Merluccius polli TaxID=89951 RepID=A0AA47NDY8_MERPO|nr:hypothetical protein N1851_000419 [Merluccius polli]
MFPRFPLLRCRMVFQKHFGADRKSFSMSSPNFSHTRCLASDTAAAAALRAHRYPATASGVLWDNIPRKASFFSRTASLTTGVHHGVRGLPPLEEPKTLRPQLTTAASAMEALNTAHSGSMPPTSTGMLEKLSRRSVQTLPPFPDPTHHQMVVSPSLPTWALKSPSRTKESPTGAPYRTPFRVSKKAEYSELLFGAYAQTTVRVFPPTTLRRREATLSSTGVNSNTAALSRGFMSIPTPARRLTPWATPEKNRVQPLSRSTVPELRLEVTFHVPRASFCRSGLVRRDPCLSLPPMWQRTRPQRVSLQVVGPQGEEGGGATQDIRCDVDEVLWPNREERLDAQ